MRLGIVMKTVPFLVSAALMLTACGSPAPVKSPAPTPRRPSDSPRVQKRCRESHGICQYRLLPDVAASRAGKLSLLCSVIVPKATPSLAKVEIGLQVSGPRVLYRECHDLQLTVDGQPLPVRDTTYDAALGQGFVVEAVTLPLSADELSRLTSAGKINYRLCKTTGIISSHDHDLLRSMFLLWKGQ